MKKTIYYFLLVVVAFSCVQEDYFGLSSQGNIKSITVSNQASNAVIDKEQALVTVEIPGGVDLSSITVRKLELSSFATSDVVAGDLIDLTDSSVINITAEDKTVYPWTIKAYIASATPQLVNGDMNLWYKTSAGYYEPGADASTYWGTGNQGTQILNKLATTPLDLGNGNLAAHLETLDNGKLAATFGTPISAGSIFTGFFNPDKIDPSDPQAAIDFGTSFTGRPDKIRLKYSYVPGAENKDKKGNLLDYPDNCDIYTLFEIRAGEKISRLATAWFRSDANQEEMKTIEIPVVFGPLDDSYPDYMKPVDHEFVSADSASFMLPTHITFVASSSFDGANFAGAIGSVLIIDDVEMVYDE